MADLKVMDLPSARSSVPVSCSPLTKTRRSGGLGVLRLGICAGEGPATEKSRAGKGDQSNANEMLLGTWADRVEQPVEHGLTLEV